MTTPCLLSFFVKSLRLLRALYTGRISVSDGEKWGLHDNYSRRRQLLSSGETEVATARPNTHTKKVMLSVCWSVRGVIH